MRGKKQIRAGAQSEVDRQRATGDRLPPWGRCASLHEGIVAAGGGRQPTGGRARDTGGSPRRKIMRNAIAFLALSVLLWLIAAPPGTAAPHEGHLSSNDGTVDSGAPCGEELDDADQVAAVRALADEECDCDSATNHGKYVNCVAKVAAEAVAEGELREDCEDGVLYCASQSTCGLSGAVTCCRTDASDNTTCSIKPSAAACKPPSGGAALDGPAPSRCDALGAPGPTPTPVPTG